MCCYSGFGGGAKALQSLPKACEQIYFGWSTHKSWFETRGFFYFFYEIKLVPIDLLYNLCKIPTTQMGHKCEDLGSMACYSKITQNFNLGSML
jgi:hypothetical protein